MKKIRFPKQSNSFFSSLKRRVEERVTKNNLLRKAKIELWAKFLFYSCLFVGFYLLLLFAQWQNTWCIILNYALLGMSGILLAFNSAHDSAHGTFSKKKWVNEIIFRFTFNLQGVNSYLWKMRHIASHHLFPNVDGCDADIDENVFLRLSPTHKKRTLHRYQHIYATVLYMFYTLHWVFIKDIGYLFTKNLSNLRDIKHPLIEVVRFFLWKGIYFTVFIVLPLYVGYEMKTVLLAFVVMHFCTSILFVWTLIISHLTMETAFPVQDKEGFLPFNFYRHQLATSMDYRPRSFIMNWLLGGFNAHAAHHLFPKWPHTMNRHITFIIQRTAVEHNMPYNSKTFVGALRSHYAYLKVMGNG